MSRFYSSTTKTQKERQMRKVKIFLASSSKLSEYREELDRNISAKNKIWHDKGISLELVIWEDLESRR